MTVRKTLRRWHLWLGWLIGVPFLLWALSGLVMVIRPIEEVRGSALLKDPPPLALPANPVAPNLAGRAVKGLSLETRVAGPRWVIRFADGGSRLADPASGNLLPTISAADAAREVTARLRAPQAVLSTARTDAAHPPLELRREVAAWQVSLADGTHYFVDAATGEIVARRTRWWRVYDFFWGIHIMDLQTREDTHNPWIVLFAAISLLTTLMALVLLPMSSRRKKKAKRTAV